MKTIIDLRDTGRLWHVLGLTMCLLVAVVATIAVPQVAMANENPTTLTIVKETNPDGGTDFPFTVLGTLPRWDSAAANPTDVGVDASGNVYVTTYHGSSIVKYDRTGTNVLAEYGGYGSSAGQFRHPDGMTVAADGRIYVADTYNHRVQQLAADGSYVRQWGVLGNGEGEFNLPVDVAVDSDGNVYVVDKNNHRIQKFTSDGTYLLQWGSQGSGDGQFDTPDSVAVDAAGNVYVADTNNHRIQKFASDGTYLLQWGDEPALSHPRSIEVSSTGYVYVGDADNQLVQVYTTDGTSVKSWVISRVGMIYNPNPLGIAVNAEGQIYVVDQLNNNIRWYDEDDAVLGNGDTHVLTVDAGSYTVTENLPDGWAASQIVCDGGNPQVKGNKVTVTLAGGDSITCTFTDIELVRNPASLTIVKETDPDGGMDFPFTALGTLGSWTYEQDGNKQIDGVDVDSAGNVFITTYHGNAVMKYDASGTHLLASWGSYGTGAGQFRAPWGVAIGGDDTVYVADRFNHRIQKFTNNGTYLLQWGGYGSGDGQFREPYDVAIDAAGNVFVVDRGNHRIQKFTSDGTYLLQWGSQGSGDGQFDTPDSVAVDAAGSVYVADTNNHRIQKFASDGTFLLQWGSQPVLNYPRAVDVDVAGNVFVGDQGNQLVQKFTSDGTLVTSWSIPRQGNYNPYPHGIAVNSEGQVYITDYLYPYVRRFWESATVLSDNESHAFTVDAGSYTITENLPDGWELTGITCDGGSPQVVGSKVTVTLAGGDNITCTFTNFLPNQPPVANPDGYSVDEDLLLDVASPGVLGNDEDPDGDPLTPALVSDVAHGTLTLHPDGSFTYMPDPDFHGMDSFTYLVSDGLVESNVAAVEITVNPVNDPPIANDLSAATDEDMAVDIVLVATDVESDSLTYEVANAPEHGTLSGTAPNLVYTPQADYFGQDNFTYRAFDGSDYSNLATVSITVNPVNDPPSADAGGPYPVDEGGSVIVAALGDDVEEGDLTFAWDLDGDGVFETAAQSATFDATRLDGPSSHTIAVQVTDAGGLAVVDTATIEVVNVAPVVGPISALLEPMQVNSDVEASASFTDAGTPDTHTAVWDWGDGNTTIGVVTEAGGNGSVTGNHAYAEAGVYTIGLTVTDDDGGDATAYFQFIVIYDPEGGFVTGGGWIDSPAGAYVADPDLTGKAQFGFVSKYKKGANVPTGNTEFQFKAGDLKFKSTSYQWLVVAGASAKFKGVGTINGAGDFGFMLTAVDGEINGGGGVDKFRIKIWEVGSESVVYDNQMGESDDSVAATEVGGGSIKIHK